MLTGITNVEIAEFQLEFYKAILPFHAIKSSSYVEDVKVEDDRKYRTISLGNLASGLPQTAGTCSTADTFQLYVILLLWISNSFLGTCYLIVKKLNTIEYRLHGIDTQSYRYIR